MKETVNVKLSDIILWVQYLQRESQSDFFFGMPFLSDEVLSKSPDELNGMPVNLEILDKAEYEAFKDFCEQEYGIKEDKLEEVIEKSIGIYIQIYKMMKVLRDLGHKTDKVHKKVEE